MLHFLLHPHASRTFILQQSDLSRTQSTKAMFLNSPIMKNEFGKNTSHWNNEKFFIYVWWYKQWYYISPAQFCNYNLNYVFMFKITTSWSKIYLWPLIKHKQSLSLGNELGGVTRARLRIGLTLDFFLMSWSKKNPGSFLCESHTPGSLANLDSSVSQNSNFSS